MADKTQPPDTEVTSPIRGPPAASAVKLLTPPQNIDDRR